MEQKQLDEIEESFVGEEFIDEDDFLEIKPKINSVKKTTKKSKNSETKTSEKVTKKVTKKNAVRKSSKEIKSKEPETKLEEPVITVVSNDELNEPLEEDKIQEHKAQDEIKIVPLKEENIKNDKSALDTSVNKETTKPIDPWADENDKDNEDEMFKGSSIWKAFTAIAVILLVFSIFTQGFNFGTTDSTTGSSTLSLTTAEDKVLNFVNNNLLQPPFTAEITSSEDVGNLYKINLAVAGQEVESYISKDGKLFFPQGFNVDDPTSGSVSEVNSQGNQDSQGSTELIDVSIDDDAIKGNPDAQVTIVEFSDFECPFCEKYFQETYSELMKNYVDTGKVRYVFRDFPLSFHPEAQKAAEAAECAGEQDLFWEMHDVLFNNQENLDIDSLKSYANNLGLDTKEFNDCLDNGLMEEEVKADFAEGQSYGVSGTPAFFINGKLISGALPYSTFEQEIEAALSAVETTDIIVEVPTEQATDTTDVVVDDLSSGTSQGTTDTTSTSGTTDTSGQTSTNVVTGNTKELTLSSKKWSFNPTNLKVQQGDLVKLEITPDGSNPTFILPEFTFSIPDFNVKEQVSGTTTIEFVADKKGTFEFKCSSCEDWRGMNGELIVE